MGWREALRNRISALGYDRIDEALFRMGPERRIALARELLPPGFVVARMVEPRPFEGCDTPLGFGQWSGWNACRAAMMEGEGSNP